MPNLVSALVTIALLFLFPVFIFWMFVRALRVPGTRWWGIVILLSILVCYCTTVVGIAGLLAGAKATGSDVLAGHYYDEFHKVLTQTETLPEAFARIDAVAASDEYQIREPDKNLRFRYVWLLGGCFLFAGANLMMFGPGRSEKRHAGDCIMMTVAALVVFLTGIWQVAWGNGYANQASFYRRMMTGWHDGIPLDAIHASNAEIAEKVASDSRTAKGPGILRDILRGYADGSPSQSGKTGEAAGSPSESSGGNVPSAAIIGGADGPTAVFLSSELTRRQSGIPAERADEADSQAESSAEEE